MAVTTKYPMVALRLRRPAQHPAGEPGRLGLLLARDRRAATNGCTTVARVSRSRRSPGSEAFRKASRHRRTCRTSDPNASEITFTWQDYYDTNVGHRRGTARPGTRRPRPTGSRSTPTRRSRSSSTPRRSTRRLTPPPTGSTPTARTTGACRPSTRGQRPDLVSPWQSFTKASPAVVPSRRSVAPWCPGRPRCAGTPRRSPRRTRSRSTRTTTRRSARPTGSSRATVRDHLGGADRPDPGLQHAVPVARPPRRLLRQPGPVVGDRVVHLVRRGAEPAHAQGRLG